MIGFLMSRKGAYLIGAIVLALVIWWVCHSLIQVGVRKCEAASKEKIDKSNVKAAAAGENYEHDKQAHQETTIAVQQGLSDLDERDPLDGHIGADRLRYLNAALTDPRKSAPAVPVSGPAAGRPS